MALTTLVTTTSLSGEKGSRALPALTAVMAKPAIIMIQTMVAAGARRAGSARSASSVRSDVPAAPTPTPMRMNATMPSERPNASWVCMIAVASAASAPPLASTAMPPMIHGVRLRPPSDPCPQRGRRICTA